MATHHPLWCNQCMAWRGHTQERHQVTKCAECGRVIDHSDQARNKGETVLEEGSPSRFCSHCATRVTEEELLVWAQNHYCCGDCRKNVHGLGVAGETQEGQQPMGGMPRHNGLVDH